MAHFKFSLTFAEPPRGSRLIFNSPATAWIGQKKIVIPPVNRKLAMTATRKSTKRTSLLEVCSRTLCSARRSIIFKLVSDSLSRLEICKFTEIWKDGMGSIRGKGRDFINGNLFWISCPLFVYTEIERERKREHRFFNFLRINTRWERFLPEFLICNYCTRWCGIKRF